MIDVDSYQKLINSINLMKLVSIGEKDFHNGNFVSGEELEHEINQILE